MAKKFTYGYDVNAYINEALKRLQECHPWATLDHFRKNCTYAIEKEGRKHVFVCYSNYDDGTSDRTFVEGDGEAFIKQIYSDQEWWIEVNNNTTESYRLDIPGEVDIAGWTLEIYEFRKHEFGGISSFIQAGNRSTGGSREFFLPNSFFEGTFDDFLERYNNFVSGCFTLPVKWAKETEGLKEFLGFKE